jgi:hypothetical protein
LHPALVVEPVPLGEDHLHDALRAAEGRAGRDPLRLDGERARSEAVLLLTRARAPRRKVGGFLVGHPGLGPARQAAILPQAAPSRIEPALVTEESAPGRIELALGWIELARGPIELALGRIELAPGPIELARPPRSRARTSSLRSQQGNGESTTVSRVAKRSRSNSSPRRRAPYCSHQTPSTRPGRHRPGQAAGALFSRSVHHTRGRVSLARAAARLNVACATARGTSGAAAAARAPAGSAARFAADVAGNDTGVAVRIGREWIDHTGGHVAAASEVGRFDVAGAARIGSSGASATARAPAGTARFGAARVARDDAALARAGAGDIAHPLVNAALRRHAIARH